MNEELKKAAESIVEGMMEKHGMYSGQKPLVKEVDGEVHIIWEAGPFDWAMNDGYTMFEELKGVGYPGEFKGSRFAEPNYFFEVPEGFYAEPVNSYTLAVYADS